MYNYEEFKDNEKLDELEDEQGNFDLQSFFLLEPAINKGEKCCNLVAFLDFQNEGIDNEIKRLQEVKKRNEKKIKNVKDYLIYLSSTNNNIKNFGTRRIVIRNTEAIEVDKDINIEEIPEQFLNIKTIKEISKTKIKDYLNSPAYIDQETGEVIPNNLAFARKVYNQSLTIK